MDKGAINFIKNRKKSVISITYNRVNHIMNYVIDCYELLVKSSTQYSRSYIAQNTTFTLEDFLKMELVENYLITNKRIIIEKCKELENINFHYEPQKRFTDINDGKEKPDKIDIYINRLGLQESWKDDDENIYIAIECKRIAKLSDCSKYLEDTYKFVNREYKKLRLPFEGQLAFIENDEITHLSISNELNNRLKAHRTIHTIRQLELIQRENYSSNNCYISKHRRNYNKKESFTIFHLLLDYSKLLVE